MATVRFSDTLKGEIRNKAKAMFQDKIQQAKDNVPAHWADKVYRCFFPIDVRQKMESLPDYVLRKQEHIEVTGWINAPEVSVAFGMFLNAGVVTATPLILLVVAMPVMMIGDRVGAWLFHRVGGAAYRPVAFVVSMALGVGLIVKAIWFSASA